jgi:hypothetical protein
MLFYHFKTNEFSRYQKKLKAGQVKCQICGEIIRKLPKWTPFVCDLCVVERLQKVAQKSSLEAHLLNVG